jgi:carbamoyltransferase
MIENVLGINCYLHDSSAALFQDGRLVFAAEEERFSRIKKDAGFPQLSIRAALEYGGIGLDDLDAIAFGWNRGGVTPLHTLRSVLTARLPLSGLMVADSVFTTAREIWRGNGRRQLHRSLGVPGRAPLVFVDHHLAHAWSAYAHSGLDESLVLVVDGRGATQATSLYHAVSGDMRRLEVIRWPNSLGAYYEAFTDLLGFERHHDEWKVMGLAAYGEPRIDLSRVIRITPRGYEIDARRVCGRYWRDISGLVEVFGPRRRPQELITDADRDLAASVQRATEEAFSSLVRHGVELTGCRHLCLAGGVAMNCKATGLLLASGTLATVFVQPAATDDGTAVGAALAAHAVLGEDVPRSRLTDVYLGPGFDTDHLAGELRRYKLHGTQVADVADLGARLLAGGAIIGWFQGRMEFGPRALGNRSILADARTAVMKDRVNECVKFREVWRPFAPSCLAEEANDYFADCHDAPFMTIAFEVRPHRRSRIPAVTHADNTARVQTVARNANPRYHRLIKRFAELTGVPVIMNTSFNLRGEPIVCTPKDAIRTFYSSGLDFLVLGDFIIAKDPAWRPEHVDPPEVLIASR